MVNSALGMLALYMRFNRTDIWGGENIFNPKVGSRSLFFLIYFFK